MPKLLFFLIAGTFAAFYQIAWAQPSKTMDVYFIDVEGGQATLFVSPSGKTLLVDAGNPGTRDADRIAAIAQQAGVKEIDYLVITHYHADHVGGLAHLVSKLPIRNFIDHGPTVETLTVAREIKYQDDSHYHLSGEERLKLFHDYTELRKRGHHIQASPRDKIPVAGIDVQVVSAAGVGITEPLPGAGATNPICSGFASKEEDQSEDAQSVGMVINYGKFRMLDLGDLTWNKEHELVCPNNLLGTVDVYVVTHHGFANSGPPVIVNALHPRVAVMSNGATKGGATETFQTLHSVAGLEDLWQLHSAINAGKENSPQEFIANLDETTAHFIKLSARTDGGFIVVNSRNGSKKEYRPRK